MAICPFTGLFLVAIYILLVIGLLGVSYGSETVAAQTSRQQKIDPALQAQMAANPVALLPVIVEMAAAGGLVTAGASPHRRPRPRWARRRASSSWAAPR